MFWVLVALLSRISFACCNVLDSYFRNLSFRNGFSQNFFGSLYYIVIIPVLYVVIKPSWPEPQYWGGILIAGVFSALYLVPYLEALKYADSSVVTSYFTLGRIFTPILAFFMINERLSLMEIMGFIVVMLGAFYLSLQAQGGAGKKFEFKPFLLMTLSGLMIALYTVSSKQVFDAWPWEKAFFYIVVVSSATSWLTYFLPSVKNHIREDMKLAPVIGRLYGLNVLFGLLGSILFFYSLALTKASYVAMAAQFQPFVVILLMFLARRFGLLKEVRESLDVAAVRKKSVAFFIMALGVLLSLQKI